MPAISPVSFLPTTASSQTSQASGSQTLGQADFLKLLVTQMTSQDPLNPQSDTDFIAQLAQFSTLQGTQNMQNQLGALQASSLMGQTVILNSTTGSQTSGVVTAVDLSSGSPEIVVNGQSYSLSQIAGYAPTAATTSTTPASTPAN